MFKKIETWKHENGPQLLQNDNDQQKIANLVDSLTHASKFARSRQQPPYIEYSEYGEPESNDVYDIDTRNAKNAMKRTNTELIIAQKKGQSEYVGFVEPKVSNQMKHRETMKKRVEVEQTVQQANLKPMLHVGQSLSTPVHQSALECFSDLALSRLLHIQRNISLLNLFDRSTGTAVFSAVATTCMLAMAAGVATGSYYYFKVRSQKTPTNSCDFTYAPTGPGKTKKKKGSGDEGLAYKAQLHHYQQAKQKIISGENGAVTIPDAYESSETSDDENNFSVYECPGLAPTGDLEASPSCLPVIQQYGGTRRGHRNRMEMECLSEVCKIEKCVSDIIDLADKWENLSAQLEATKKAIFETKL
uniref:Uncharacterized protein n=1 Tax=Setaria digitata TaxID=48799 RepID=A0A915Q7X4_9BILA